MRSKWIVGGLTLFMALLFAGGARATTIDPTHSGVFYYDLSASPDPGPFVSVDYDLLIASDDPLDLTDVLQVTTFDSSGVENHSTTIPNIFGFAVSGALATGNTLSVPTTEKTGYIEVGMVTGSIDLTGVNAQLHFIDPSSGFTGYVTTTPATLPTPSNVPEPGTFTLLVVGLCGLAGLKACHRPGVAAKA